MVVASGTCLSWEKERIDLRRWAVDEEWFSLSPGNSARGDSPVSESRADIASAPATGTFLFSARCSFSGTDLSTEGQQVETRNKASFLCFWLIAKLDRWCFECNLNRWTSILVLNTPILAWAASFHSLCVINLLQNKKSQVKLILRGGKLATGIEISVHPGSEVVPSTWGINYL